MISHLFKLLLHFIGLFCSFLFVRCLKWKKKLHHIRITFIVWTVFVNYMVAGWSILHKMLIHLRITILNFSYSFWRWDQPKSNIFFGTVFNLIWYLLCLLPVLFKFLMASLVRFCLGYLYCNCIFVYFDSFSQMTEFFFFWQT